MSGELGEFLCKEQKNAFFSGWVSTLPGHIGFQPTQALAAAKVSNENCMVLCRKSCSPVLQHEVVGPSGKQKGFGFGPLCFQIPPLQLSRCVSSNK